MNFLRKLWHVVALNLLSVSIRLETDQTKRELLEEEEKLRALLLSQLKLKRGDLDLRLRPSPNGFLVPKVEFFVDATPAQIETARQFLDRITLSRQNVRSVSGVH